MEETEAVHNIKNREKSPSPEPFREPEGMVTIDLDRETPPPRYPVKRQDQEKSRSECTGSFTFIISFLCLMSLCATVFIHREDVVFLFKKFTETSLNESHYDSLASGTTDKIQIEMQTCPIDPYEKYKIKLLICEKTGKYVDCCQEELQNNIEELGELCSMLGLLDSLIESQELLKSRMKRHDTDSYFDKSHNSEMEDKLKKENETKKKILSYMKRLNEPLRKEIPSLWNWIGNMFFMTKDDIDEEETYHFQPITNSDNRRTKPIKHIGTDFPKDKRPHAIDSLSLPQETHILKPIFVENFDDTQANKEQDDEKTPDEDIIRPHFRNIHFEHIEGGDSGKTEDDHENIPDEAEDVEYKSDHHTSDEYVGLGPKKTSSDPLKQEIVRTEMKEGVIPENDEPRHVEISEINELHSFSRKKRQESYPPLILNEIERPYEEESPPEDLRAIYEEDFQTYPKEYQLSTFPDPDDNGNSLDPTLGFTQNPEETDVRETQSTILPQRYHSEIGGQASEDSNLQSPIYTEEENLRNVPLFDYNKFFQEEAGERQLDKNVWINEQRNANDEIISPEKPEASTGQIDIGSEISKFNVENNFTTKDDIANARDTIQAIDNVHADNRSISVDFENTSIVVSKANGVFDHPREPLPKTFEEEESATTTVAQSISSEERISGPESRGSQQQIDFTDKSKENHFPSMNEDLQSTQNIAHNPCPYSSTLGVPYRYSVSNENPQVLNVLPSSNIQKSSPVYVINPSVFSYVPPSPVISHYGPINQHFNPYGYVNTIAGIPTQTSMNTPSQMTTANGQYYLCNPVSVPSSSQLANIPGVEIRTSDSNLQDSVDSVVSSRKPSNLTRAALNCPMDEQSCLDGSKCISLRHVCDNEVHCEDGSDEMFCSCKDRIGDLRLCDGYYDCPDGEDERGCFGCMENEISCDDWSRFRKGSCISIEQRCDGVRQCEVTGKDEDDCSILTDHIGERNPIKVSNAAGFLHRNFKGKWYPTCFGSEIWAMDVCKTEAGPSTVAPKSHLIPTNEKYGGNFVSILPNQEISLVPTCVTDRASFVECPPLFCGLRMTVKNPYRPQELDTSMEDMMNHLSRNNDLLRNILNSSDFDGVDGSSETSDPFLGSGRVVGGKPSQPAAWPWVVSIYKNGIFHCGGVIINELWIVTAAHCVDKYWLFYYEVQAGILRRFSFSPMEQSRWVVAAIAHEDYDKTNLKNDIALMRLSSPVRYNRYVRPICLPSETTAGQDFLRGPLPGTICTTVGWGATVEHGTDPDHMREVEVPVLKNCKHQEDVEGHEICAGLFEGGKDACQGDSGGPFMCQNPNNPTQWYLAGIVSHGEGCARPNEPGVYTRVSEYITWIAENMREGTFFPRTPLQRCPGYVCRGSNKCIPKKRHCDKIVDCLMGDDESNCENTVHNIFKHSRRNFAPFFRTPDELSDDDISRVAEDLPEDQVVGTSIVNAENTKENQTIAENLNEMINGTEKTIMRSRVRPYERRIYFSNNTADPNIFKCTKMLQIIPVDKRCNKVVDCEDGSDEDNCQCADLINMNHPVSICDGIVDCYDQSDERFCSSCLDDEFDCERSRMCISMNLRCDGKPDCVKGEDEWNCVALTNGETITIDSDSSPIMKLKGIISINQLGSWKPYCSTNSSAVKSDAEIATNVCNYLGSEEYVGYRRLEIKSKRLRVERYNSGVVSENPILNHTKCEGIFLSCSNLTLNNEAFQLTQRNTTVDFDEMFEAPWSAAVYGDGEFKCMGVILDENWVISSRKCFSGTVPNSLMYVAVSLAKGKRYLHVRGPHDKNVKVRKILPVNQTDIILLKLNQAITFNRHVQRTHLIPRIDERRDEKCIAVGTMHGGTKFIFLHSNATCSRGFKCFSLLDKKDCIKDPWIGVVTCNSGNGWYPSSVFNVKVGSCAFSKKTKLTDVKYWIREIEGLKNSKEIEDNISLSKCHGFRCELGNCLEEDQVCDGIRQCIGGEDEDMRLCEFRNTSCHLSNSCACPMDHLTCANGECVPKNKFCDRNDDCGDLSDEPYKCTCRAYLELTHPERICDGVLNCFDRSDEDSNLCPCQLTDFKCGESNICVANDLVCDGFKDCPNAEDEEECYVLSQNSTKEHTTSEVLTKLAGRIVPSCFEETPTKEVLDNMCRQFGFTSCVDKKLLPYHDETNAIFPAIDSFGVVWIRRDRKVPLMYRMRTGNDAYLSFRKQDNCQRLLIECL